MAQSASGGGKTPSESGEVQQLGSSKLVVEQVEIIRRRVPIDIPELVIRTEETTRYVPKTEPTIKYVTTEEPTIKYVVDERETTKYNTVEEKTVKYIPQEVTCEKPVLVNKPYERPVVVDKEYTIVTYADIEAIRELMDLAPKLLAQLKAIKEYQIVKEVIKVPELHYVPTTIKKISKTGELIDDAN